MALEVRRVVTGHDANGKATVMIDEIMPNTFSNRPGATGANIWITEGFPVNNDGTEDQSTRPVATTIENGTIFRVLELQPGSAPRNHRTDSIDYAVVMKGEVDMELDGTTVTLRAGDTLVQRGTIHNWINRGTEPCLIAFILIAAKPVEVNGQTLAAHG